MKKIFASVLAFALMFSLSIPVFAAEVKNNNGETIGEVKVIDGAEYIPLRKTVEYFNYGCQWNQEEQNITITNTRHGAVILTPGKDTYETKYFTWTMEKPVICIDGTSYVDATLFMLLGHTVCKTANDPNEIPDITLMNIYH